MLENENLKKQSPSFLSYTKRRERQTERARIRDRIVEYAVLFLVTFGSFIFIYFSKSDFQTNSQFHTILDILAAVMSLLVGIMALIKYYTRSNDKYLFIGYGFLGTALFDGYHALIASNLLQTFYPSLANPDYIDWTFNLSRVFLAIWLLVSFLIWKFEDDIDKTKNRGFFNIFLAFGITSIFIIISFMPIYFTKYLTYFSALIFFITLLGYLKKGFWKFKYFEHWLVLALILSFVSQAFYMPFSANHYDAMSFLTHLMRNMAYVFSLIGLLMSMYIAFEEVEEGKEKMNAIIQSMGDAVFVCNSDGRIILMNKEAEKFSEFSFEDAIDKKYTDIFKFSFEKEEKKKYPDFVGEVIKIGKTKELGNHTILTSKNSSILPVSISAAPIKDDATQRSLGCIVVVHNMTRERELEIAKDNFLSIAAHQLRTPLGSMRWNMEMLLSGDVGKISEEIKQVLMQIHGSNTRLIGLVNNLLNVSRIDQHRVSDKPEETDLLKIIKEAAKEIEPETVRRQVTISMKEKGRIPKIIIDGKRFREVIQNLLSNAVKYNKRDGKVNVLIEKLETKIKIIIEDTGIGIPKKDQDKLFSKFFRAVNAISSATDGSGLGLFVVKSYIESWGGSVSFKSEEGKGTTFVIILPLKPKQHVLDKNLEEHPHTLKE